MFPFPRGLANSVQVPPTLKKPKPLTKAQNKPTVAAVATTTVPAKGSKVQLASPPSPSPSPEVRNNAEVVPLSTSEQSGLLFLRSLTLGRSSLYVLRVC